MPATRTMSALFLALVSVAGLASKATAQVVSNLWINQQLIIGQNTSIMQGSGFLTAQVEDKDVFMDQANLVNLPTGQKGLLTAFLPYQIDGVSQWKIAFSRDGLLGGTIDYINVTPWIQNAAKGQMWWTIPEQSQVADRLAYDLPDSTNQLMPGDHVKILAFSNSRYHYETGLNDPTDLLPVFGEALIDAVGDPAGPDHFLYYFDPATPNMIGANDGMSSLGLVDFSNNVLKGVVNQGAYQELTFGWRVDNSVIPTPEPGSLTLLAVAIANGVYMKRKRRFQARVG